ncbi:MAG: cobalamin biosynthesis protein [Firmicutes bacterium]|nr:cobalamin biosynthesis protein [Bacillota bacterium]
MVLVTNKKMEMDIERITRPFLFLRPRNLIAGIGCRRGTAAGTILAAVGLALARAGLAAASLKMLASIDVKSAEKGLIQAAQRLGIPLKLFSAREIQGLEGQFAVSEFVKKTVGVGAVCEPVAMLAGGNRTRLVLPKIVHQGVTVAVAEESCP